MRGSTVRPWLAGAAIAGLLATGMALAPIPAAAESAAKSAADDQAITELIVAYETGVPPAEAPGVATGSSAVTGADLAPGTPIGFGMRTVRLGAAVDAATAERIAAQLDSSPGVRFAEPNSIVTLSATVVQPSPPWGLDRIDQRALPLDGTYQYSSDSTGSGVTAYVIDSGIRSTHVDFTGRIGSGYAGIADGGGTEDCNGHGTHVAGTLGGTTYGVAKQSTLVPVRVFGCESSTTLDIIIAGIDWTVTDHASGAPAVANMSFGAAGSDALDTAVSALISDGVTVVAASGNDTLDACQVSPARVPAAITVNASDDADAAASFSNFGSCTDLYAPGVAITSAAITSDTAAVSSSGTSMAAPHVAGAAARILDVNPAFSPAQVWTAMAATATPITFAPASGDPDLLLYASPASAPDAPTGAGATAGNQSTTVTWTAPVSDGGSAVTSYTARAWDAASGGSHGSLTCTPSPATDLGCSITGLTNDTTYYVDVIATNAVGTSAPSSPRVSTQPVGTGVPSQPRSATATPADASLVTSWLAPASSGGSAIASYSARAWTAASGGSIVRTCTPSPATDLGCTITGLANGTTYYIDVTATNTAGASLPSSPRASGSPVAAAPPASGGGGGGGGSSSPSSGGGGGGGSIWQVVEVRPAFGPASGGTRVLVLGYGFTGATAVTIGGVTAPGFTFINDATIEILTPPGTEGLQELRVRLPNGSAPATFQYTSEAPAAASPPPPTNAPTPPTTSTVSTDGVRIGPATSPILRVTRALAAQTAVTTVRRAALRPAGAPTVTGDAGDAFRLRVTGLPRSSTAKTLIRVGGRYYALGRARITTTGSALLPTFIAQRPGTYLVKVTPAGAKARYVKVLVR